ncbi:hypothetical protein OH492_14565 [Vibrio chagasii]|nr:hypothetical protein [Vibrio chagasii]
MTTNGAPAAINKLMMLMNILVSNNVTASSPGTVLVTCKLVMFHLDVLGASLHRVGVHRLIPSLLNGSRNSSQERRFGLLKAAKQRQYF